MILEVDGNQVTGTYRTGVGKPDSAESFPLSGYANGELIAFAVNFGEHGSLTTWMGQIAASADGGEEIRTLWHLGRQTDDKGDAIEPWARILAGSTVFVRVN